jgi:autotransporter-associated beta strand protein
MATHFRSQMRISIRRPRSLGVFSITALAVFFFASASPFVTAASLERELLDPRDPFTLDPLISLSAGTLTTPTASQPTLSRPSITTTSPITPVTSPNGPLAPLGTDRFWSGGGGNDNISQSGNWFSPGQPTGGAGDNLTFNNTTGSHHFAYFDYGDYSQFGNINIFAGAGIGQLYGNALKFTDYIKNNDNSNQWNIYNNNVSARTSSGSTIYVIANGGGFNFKLDGSGGTGSGDGGHFYLDTVTLEVQGSASTTFQCIISDGNGTGNVNANNSGTVTFSGSNANTYTGSTTVTQGTLALNKDAGVNAIAGSSLVVNNSGSAVQWGANNQVNNTTTVTLNGGTLKLNGKSEGATGAGGVGIGALTLQANSIIDMSATSLIHFAASNLQTWIVSAGSLQIWNWSGTPVTGGGTEEILFGTNALGLTVAQLADFQFYSGAGTGAYTPGGVILSTGEIVPVPEPATWVGGALALTALILSQRRRFMRRRLSVIS